MLLTLLLACRCATGPRPPDVVLVVVDTLRADAPGYAGNPRPTTPNLDALAATEAAWFSRASACASWTLPSVATLLTGEYPWKHGVFRVMEGQDLWGRLDPGATTLATVFHERGYRTAAYINNSFLAPEFGLNLGFDVYDYHGAELLELRGAAETVQAALRWLDDEEDPAFLLIHLMEPHFDYAAPEPYRGRFTAALPHTASAPFGRDLQVAWMQRRAAPSREDAAYIRAAYDEEVLAIDAAIGDLIAGLRAQDRWNDAVFVVTADHGEELWDQGGFEHGHTTRGAVTRVPLLVRAPGVVPGRNDTLVDHTDLYAMLAGGEGRLHSAAHSGVSASGGVVFAQELLYGPQQISAADERLRLIIELGSRRTELWRLDEGWREQEALHTLQNRSETGAALRDAILRERGDLNPSAPNNPLPIGDAAASQRLQSLGYVD